MSELKETKIKELYILERGSVNPLIQSQIIAIRLVTEDGRNIVLPMPIKESGKDGDDVAD